MAMVRKPFASKPVAVQLVPTQKTNVVTFSRWDVEREMAFIRGLGKFGAYQAIRMSRSQLLVGYLIGLSKRSKAFTEPELTKLREFARDELRKEQG